MLRTTRSIRAPACEAAYSSSIISESTSAFIFIVITPPACACAADELAQRVAQVHRRDEQAAVLARAAVAGEVVEQLREVGAEVGVARQHAEVLVGRRGLRVVVAGADVAVAADAVGLLAHDEQDLGVRLQPDEAVHDVRARLLEHAGPFDVRLLVEARFQLDERDHLLARFGRLDERRDDAGLVAAGAVQRLLDREHVRIARGLLRRTARPSSRTSRTGGAASMSPLRIAQNTSLSSPPASGGGFCGVNGGNFSSGRRSA